MRYSASHVYFDSPLPSASTSFHNYSRYTVRYPLAASPPLCHSVFIQILFIEANLHSTSIFTPSVRF